MQNSILPILKKNKLIGTGFCIYYDEEEKKSYILTCHHVLEGQNNFEIQGEEPEIIVHNECYDMSIVTISTKIEPLELVDDELVDEAMLYNLQEYSSGCIGEEVEGRVCEDIIPATQHRCNRIIESQRLEIIDDKAVIKKGNSGSPVFCKKTKRVVAMANIKYDMSKAEKVFSLKISYLKKIWDEIPLDLIAIGTSKNSQVIISKIMDTLPPKPQKEESSSLEQIFLIFRESNSQNMGYNVECYIHYEDYSENLFIPFIFTNINDKQEQENFIETIINEYFEDVSIHFIIPEELFFTNFKQWKYNDNELCNSYHIILHNVYNYESNPRKYLNMIKNWDKLYQKLKDLTISNALMRVDDNNKFHTKAILKVENKKIARIGAYFNQELSTYSSIKNILSTAKIGLWQYEQGVLDDYQRWVHGDKYLNRLKDDSRECDHVALLWDDMRLLEELKRRI